MVNLYVKETKLRKIRKSQKMSLRVLSNITGISVTSLNEIENRHIYASKKNIDLIAEALHVSPGEISDDILSYNWRDDIIK